MLAMPNILVRYLLIKRSCCNVLLTNFCSPLILALAESVSVKVVLYKRCNLCPVLYSTTDEASQSLGWNVWRPEALQAGVLRLHEEFCCIPFQSSRRSSRSACPAPSLCVFECCERNPALGMIRWVKHHTDHGTQNHSSKTWKDHVHNNKTTPK